MSDDAPKINMSPGLISWNELVSNDLAGSREFYARMFDWSVEAMPMSNGVYHFMKVGDRPAAGLLQMPAEAKGAPTMWMPYITVTNLKEAVAKATSVGAKLCKDITSIPNMGSFAIINDPQGATLGLWEFAQ